jgi:glutaredoxin
MVKVQLVYTQMCPHCPAAKELFRELEKQYKFDYKEIDAVTPEGQKLVIKHNIMSVPTTIVEDEEGNAYVAFVGVPHKNQVIEKLFRKR